jgi:hypothetical protein
MIETAAELEGTTRSDFVGKDFSKGRGTSDQPNEKIKDRALSLARHFCHSPSSVALRMHPFCQADFIYRAGPGMKEGIMPRFRSEE